jgi:hypothetical protein
MMTANADRPTRAEQVRRRRMQETKRRHQSVSHEATTVRPLISRPRRVEGRGVKPLRRGRRYEFALGSQTLSMPALSLPEITLNWRMASLTMVILLTAMLARLLTERSMFVTAINLGGASLVPAQEIFAESGMAGEHIFWVDAAEAQKRIAAIPGIATAAVAVEWPANVTVVVEERTPKLTLLEDGKKWWVDAEGQKFLSRGDLPGLLPIESDTQAVLEALPPDAVQGALQMKELRPNIEKLYYDPQHGLSYQDGRGWRGYFGVGTDMAQKLAVYERLIDNLAAKSVYPTLISVEDLDAPFYRK